ncbi:hypothetical protein [Kushneria aurantia]|uniref:Uncharacterized protein n=1 Tax=Kushneria aurantia TaxID=504092 RepID=A0ABV6G5J9_9GAMM|nr:hypothetical protein [Kushneria aurantia]
MYRKKILQLPGDNLPVMQRKFGQRFFLKDLLERQSAAHRNISFYRREALRVGTALAAKPGYHEAAR